MKGRFRKGKKASKLFGQSARQLKFHVRYLAWLERKRLAKIAAMKTLTAGLAAATGATQLLAIQARPIKKDDLQAKQEKALDIAESVLNTALAINTAFNQNF